MEKSKTWSVTIYQGYTHTHTHTLIAVVFKEEKSNIFLCLLMHFFHYWRRTKEKIPPIYQFCNYSLSLRHVQSGRSNPYECQNAFFLLYHKGYYSGAHPYDLSKRPEALLFLIDFSHFFFWSTSLISISKDWISSSSSSLNYPLSRRLLEAACSRAAWLPACLPSKGRFWPLETTLRSWESLLLTSKYHLIRRCSREPFSKSPRVILISWLLQFPPDILEAKVPIKGEGRGGVLGMAYRSVNSISPRHFFLWTRRTI